MEEVSEPLGPSLICDLCLKELYQCVLFRKKCQSADEFWNQRTATTENILWDQESDCVSESKELKLESLDDDRELAENYVISYEVQPEEYEESQVGESFDDNTEDCFVEEAVDEISIASTNHRELKSRKSTNNT